MDKDYVTRFANENYVAGSIPQVHFQSKEPLSFNENLISFKFNGIDKDDLKIEDVEKFCDCHKKRCVYTRSSEMNFHD
jgi:hypothetical protein